MKSKYILKVALSALLLVITGCNTDPNKGKATNFNPVEAKATESKDLHFFATGTDFILSNDDLMKAEKVLKTAISLGETNVSFMFISNVAVPEEIKEIAREKIRALMYKVGFLDSRIIDEGSAVYNKARVGVRINVLKYHVDKVNLDLWDEEIGDANIYKHIPRFGSSGAYNLNEMIENTADLTRARKYKGQRVADAVEALSSSGSSGGSSGGGSSGGSSSGSSK